MFIAYPHCTKHRLGARHTKMKRQNPCSHEVYILLGKRDNKHTGILESFKSKEENKITIKAAQSDGGRAVLLLLLG